jgi:hypothetical protein
MPLNVNADQLKQRLERKAEAGVKNEREANLKREISSRMIL